MRDFIVKDSNGDQLNDDESVTLLKSLKVMAPCSSRYAGKKIRITDNDEVACKVDGMRIVLRTGFLN